MGKYFGTDGFRGEANVELTADHAFRIGKKVGDIFNRKKAGKGPCRVVIGKDTRRSGYMLEYALAAGLCAVGADACLLHVTTTPSVAYLVRSEDFDCGIMISASHNVFSDNGIKLIGAGGEKMNESITDEIEAYLDGKTPEVPLAHGAAIGSAVDYAVGRNRYIGYLLSLVTHSFKGLRIGLDCANGAAWTLARIVFEALGAKVTTINASPNGRNINDACGSTHIGSLVALVKQEKLDLGFAYDGDADRCLAVDETGRVITGDGILYFCAKAMARRGELVGNRVITTVMSNFGLYKALDEAGIGYEKTPVGDRFVYEAMCQTGARLGGEDSGHIIFSKYATTGDGILTSLRIVEEMLEAKTTLSHMVDGLTIYPQLLKNIPTSHKAELVAQPAVQAAIAAAEASLADNGRILVRASGTEPLVRVMVEAPTEEDCRRHVEAVSEVLIQTEAALSV